MKIKEGFILRKIAGTNMVVPIGNNIANFNGIISLNETATFLWNHLSEGSDPEVLAETLVETYHISRELAREDTRNFMTQLQQADILTE